MLKAINSHSNNRLWYSDAYFDLIIWRDKNKEVEAFQLCYDIEHFERSLSWSKAYGFSHAQIDGGEANPLKNQSPLFVADGIFEYDTIINRFKKASQSIDEEIRTFILQKMSQYALR